MFCVYFFHIFSDSCQTNYLNIYQTDLHEICSDGRTLAVDERSAVSFFMPQGTLSWQTIFVDCIFCHARSPKRLAPLAPLEATGSTFSWLQSYLANRTSSVRVGRHCSSSVTCTTGFRSGTITLHGLHLSHRRHRPPSQYR